jgi:RNA polymerase sigma-70 factor (ECF subfamily)
MQDDEMDDQEVIRRTLAGEKDLYRILVTRYRRDIHMRANRLIPRHVDCADAVQETFVRAYFKLKDFRPDGDFRAWLFGFLRNIAGDSYRRAARESGVSWDEVCDYMTSLAEQPVPETGSSFLERLAACMGVLGEKAKRLIRLRYEEGKSAKAAGLLMGMTPPAVNVALLRTRDQLRHCIETHTGVEA